MKRPSLLSQILALNLLMVTAGIFVASIASGLDFTTQGQRWQFLILAMALVLTFLLNTLLLRRRFEPLERLLAMMERVDLSRPGRRLKLDTDMPGVSADIQRLAASFNRMLERLERERRRSGEMVLQAQEEERKRIARDLHDEVNQALTALLLRIEAAAQDAPPALQAELAETKRIANQAMGELLDLARQLRPTALDDHGLVAALRTHVREQDRRGPARISFWADPALGDLAPEVQVVIYRVAQEALVNAARHSGATRIEVALERALGRPSERPLEKPDSSVILLVADNGSGFAFAEEGKGLGLSGMRERALLVGAKLEIDSRPGKGTTVRLEVPADGAPVPDHTAESEKADGTKDEKADGTVALHEAGAP
jgi:two-component system sensor histidine kinase UhpB